MQLACSCQASWKAVGRTAIVQGLPNGPAGLEAGCCQQVESVSISQGLCSMRLALRTAVKTQHAHLLIERDRSQGGCCLGLHDLHILLLQVNMQLCRGVGLYVSGHHSLVSISTQG